MASVLDITHDLPAVEPITINTEPTTVRVDRNKMALIVIDMQNYFLHKNGSKSLRGLDTSKGLNLVKPINELISELRKKIIPIYWVNWGCRPDLQDVHYSDYRHKKYSYDERDPTTNARYFCPAEGTWDAQIYEELDYQPTKDTWINKRRLSGFFETGLDDILHANNRKTLLFAGVNTDQCVLTTVVDACFSRFDCVLLKDCCATSSPEFCTEATYFNVKTCYGFLAESKDVITGLHS